MCNRSASACKWHNFTRRRESWGEVRPLNLATCTTVVSPQVRRSCVQFRTFPLETVIYFHCSPWEWLKKSREFITVWELTIHILLTFLSSFTVMCSVIKNPIHSFAVLQLSFLSLCSFVFTDLPLCLLVSPTFFSFFSSVPSTLHRVIILKDRYTGSTN